uniref:Uncharacterized protein n=1 Tax=Setaria viridis TaxID=4556 RepID=A0A4U6WS68_SETVI|nr:hypothetical protein SEVIR_1G353432v2 [Setaria viridis]
MIRRRADGQGDRGWISASRPATRAGSEEQGQAARCGDHPGSYVVGRGAKRWSK